MKSSITPVCVYHLTSFLTQTCKTDNMTSDERFHKNTNILNSVRWSHAITYIKYTHGPMHTQTVSSLFQSAVFTGSSVKEKCKLILFHSPQSAVCVPSLPAVQVCAWVCTHTTNAQKPKHQHQNRFTTTTYCIFFMMTETADIYGCCSWSHCDANLEQDCSSVFNMLYVWVQAVTIICAMTN